MLKDIEAVGTRQQVKLDVAGGKPSMVDVWNRIAAVLMFGAGMFSAGVWVGT